MKSTHSIALAVLALASAYAPARADDGLHGATRLGEHPAVLVARRGVSADPSANFYLHPARLSWSLSRPQSEREHPAVLIAHHAGSAPLDPNPFVPAHPPRGAFSPQVQ